MASITAGLTTISSDGSVGTEPWTDIAKAAVQDDDAAYVGLMNYSGLPGIIYTSHYLCGTGGDFSALPDNVEVQSIIARVRRRCQNQDGLIFAWQRAYDARVRLLRGGVILPLEMASSSSWTTTFTTASYNGGLWNAAWTAADIRHNGFGLAISVSANASGSPSDWFRAYIDALSITVNYVLTPLPRGIR